MAYIYIESSSISNFFWRESSKYYGYEILTPSFCFQIPPGEGVKNIMAALHWTPSFSNSQREAQNSMAVNYWDLQIFQIPSGGEGGGVKILWIRYIKPVFNFYCYRREGSKTLWLWYIKISLLCSITNREGVQNIMEAISCVPSYFQFSLERGFNIPWLRWIDTPPPLIFITIKEWVQNFMAAICPPVLFYNFI